MRTLIFQIFHLQIFRHQKRLCLFHALGNVPGSTQSLKSFQEDIIFLLIIFTIVFKITNNEQTIYQNSKDKLGYFVKQWTKKEAYLKCFNDGITNINSLKIEKKVQTIKVVDYFDQEYCLSYIVK